MSIDPHMNNQQTEDVHQDSLQKKIKELYRLYFKDVFQMVSQNSGQMEDARDLFQDIAMNFLKLIQSGTTGVIQNEKHYLMGMARNLWLSRLKKTKHVASYDEQFIPDPEDRSGFDPDRESLIELIAAKLSEISKECSQIIYESFYMKRSNPELATIMGYTEQFIKVKKHRCLQSLKKLVMESPGYKNIEFS